MRRLIVSVLETIILSIRFTKRRSLLLDKAVQWANK